MIKYEDRYQDFRSKIVKADSHEEAEEVMKEMTFANIRRICDEITDKRGDGEVFENDEFMVIHRPDISDPVSLIERKKGNRDYRREGVVYQESSGDIVEFKPMECWNILNFLEEIIETGEIQV